MIKHHTLNPSPDMYPMNQPGQMLNDPRSHDANLQRTDYTQMSTPADTSILGVNFHDQQFWKGALLGAAVTLIVTNETVQKGIIKTVAKLYGSMQSGVQEIKEKFEDVQAELKHNAKEK